MLESLTELLKYFLHFDEVLQKVVQDYQSWTYLILFAIVFVETGLVVMPFLPGDSLLFAAGYIASPAVGGLNVWLVCLLLFVAAVLGDTVNYHIGKWLGPRVLSGRLSRWLNPKHLERTQWFFEHYGAKTIILARFVPIVRTFAPFMAGVGAMNYGKFLAYNVIGGAIWVLSMTFAGYYLGQITWVKEHFEIVVLAIVGISVLPMVIEVVLHRFRRETPKSALSLKEAVND